MRAITPLSGRFVHRERLPGRRVQESSKKCQEPKFEIFNYQNGYPNESFNGKKNFYTRVILEEIGSFRRKFKSHSTGGVGQ